MPSVMWEKDTRWAKWSSRCETRLPGCIPSATHKKLGTHCIKMTAFLTDLFSVPKLR